MKERENTTLPPVFKAMADMTRLKILLMLESQPRTVGEIVSFFNLSQPTITRHLQTLMSAGLVKRTRQGQHVCYELNTENLRSTCVTMMACFPCCGFEIKAAGQINLCGISEDSSSNMNPESRESPAKKESNQTKPKGGRK